MGIDGMINDNNSWLSNKIFGDEKMKCRRPVFPSTVLSLLLAFLLSPLTAAAANQLVEVYHHQDMEGKARLELNISEPVPASIIISLNLPPQFAILEAAPPVKKHSKKDNEVKWLLKDLQPGRHQITYRLSSPLPPEQFECIVQYRDPRTGEMVSRKISSDSAP
jgi:hypothetical protein